MPQDGPLALPNPRTCDTFNKQDYLAAENQDVFLLVVNVDDISFSLGYDWWCSDTFLLHGEVMIDINSSLLI